MVENLNFFDEKKGIVTRVEIHYVYRYVPRGLIQPSLLSYLSLIH